MNKKQKETMLKQLTERLQNMAIPALSKELEELDNARKVAVLNTLAPERFQELVAHEYKTIEFNHLWPRTSNIEENTIKCIHLDALSPRLLIYVGSQCTTGTGAWGEWNHRQLNKTGSASCMIEYFARCRKNRIAEILTFLIESTKGVTRSKLDGGIFNYQENEQFPDELLQMFSSVHPRLFFAAATMLPLQLYKRMLWVADVIRDGDPMESVFADSYSGKNKTVRIDENIIQAIAKHIGLLDNQKLFMMLKLFSENIQLAITEKLGKERLIEMKKEKFFNKSIKVPEEMSLYADVDPNEKVVEEILGGKKSVRQLKAKKVVELLGELALT